MPGDPCQPWVEHTPPDLWPHHRARPSLCCADPAPLQGDIDAAEGIDLDGVDIEQAERETEYRAAAIQLVREADASGDAASLRERLDEAAAAGVPEWQLEASARRLESLEVEQRIEAALRAHPIDEALLAQCCDEAEAVGLGTGAAQQAQVWLRERQAHRRERLEVESAVRAVLLNADPEPTPEPPAIGSRPATPASKGTWPGRYSCHSV